MTHPRPRTIRRPLAPVRCPGCGRPDVAVRGLLQLIAPHTVPRRDGEPAERPNGHGGTTRARPRCGWSGDPVPGRPDGRLSRADAERLHAERSIEQLSA